MYTKLYTMFAVYLVYSDIALSRLASEYTDCIQTVYRLYTDCILYAAYTGIQRYTVYVSTTVCTPPLSARGPSEVPQSPARSLK